MDAQLPTSEQPNREQLSKERLYKHYGTSCEHAEQATRQTPPCLPSRVRVVTLDKLELETKCNMCLQPQKTKSLQESGLLEG